MKTMTNHKKMKTKMVVWSYSEFFKRTTWSLKSESSVCLQRRRQLTSTRNEQRKT